MTTQDQTISSLLALAFLALPPLTLVLFVATSACGFPNSPLVFPTALLLTVAALTYLLRRTKHFAKQVFPVALLFVVSVAFILGACSLVFDNSWDGQTYHQEIVMRIVKEWNPIRTLKDPVYQVMPPWFNAKGHEFIATAIYAVTHNIESAKATNLFVFIASIFFSFEFYKSVMRNRKIASVFALLSAMNPVTVVQLSTYCVDGAVGSVFLCLVSSIGLVFLEQNTLLAIIGIICSVILLMSLKLSVVWLLSVTFICSMAFSFFYFRDLKKSIHLLKLSAVACAIALVVGINPYALNTYHLIRHPMASIKLSAESVKFIGRFAPPEFFRSFPNQFLRMGASLFATTNNSNDIASGADFAKIYPSKLVQEHPNLQPEEFDHRTVNIAPPFAFTALELALFNRCDVRVGGFGPWFGELLVLSFVLLLIVLVRHQKEKLSTESKVVLFLAGVVALSALFLEHAWWARFVPQFWLLPICFLIASRQMQKNANGAQAIIAVALILLTGEVLLVAVPNLVANWRVSTVFHAELSKAKARCEQENLVINIYAPKFVTLYPTVEERIREAKVPCKLTDIPPAPTDYCYRVTDLPIFCYAAQRSRP